MRSAGVASDPLFDIADMLMLPNGGQVAHLQVDVVVGRDGLEDAIPDADLGPAPEAVGAGGRRPIALRDVVQGEPVRSRHSMIEAPTVVLVVEDEALLRLLLMEVLEEAGFEVIEARTADDAVLLLDHRPDIRLVFTDVDMPGALDGFQLAQYVGITTAMWPSSSVLESAARAGRD